MASGTSTATPRSRAHTCSARQAKHALPADQWLEIDRYAVALAQSLQTEVLGHYDRYEFHPVVAKLQTFCSEDLGGFYLDILKDRLYTSAPDSPARRAACWSRSADRTPPASPQRRNMPMSSAASSRSICRRHWAMRSPSRSAAPSRWRAKSR